MVVAEERSKKKPKHGTSSGGGGDDEEQAEASPDNSSVYYEDLKRTTQDLISRGHNLERTLPSGSRGSRKQKRWEKRCRKHMKLLDERLMKENAGQHAIPSKSLGIDAKSLQALRSTKPSSSAGETVQDKWLRLKRRASVGAPTAVPVTAPTIPEAELGQERAYVVAPGPVAPRSFTSYAPRSESPEDAEGQDDTGQKEDAISSTNSGKKQRRRSCTEWLGKSTTPIPPPILPLSSTHKPS
ncbi:uncharacterized protein PG986_013414 [Apiospora aurea]|uniref:Uncharacterized protein n=1 Tax=Apiospora aurea TaxID=335848 RepID=A0ABR1PVH5_9PEZI